MIVEVPVYHHPDGTRSIGQPDPRHGIKLGRIAMADGEQGADDCECLSCLSDMKGIYPCLLEEYVG